MRRNVGALAVFAAAVMTPSHIAPPPDAEDEKPERAQRSSLHGYYGIPYPNLKLVSRETLNKPCNFHDGINLHRRDVRRPLRKRRMQLRKRRGWR